MAPAPNGWTGSSGSTASGRTRPWCGPRTATAGSIGEVAQYGDVYRYCYVRGPAGVVIGLVEELGRTDTSDGAAGCYGTVFRKIDGSSKVLDASTPCPLVKSFVSFPAQSAIGAPLTESGW